MSLIKIKHILSLFLSVCARSLFFRRKKTTVLDFSPYINCFDKICNDDCGLQSVRSLCSFFQDELGVYEDIYDERKNKLIITTENGLIYNKLHQSYYLTKYNITIYSFLPELLLCLFLEKYRIPCILSVKNKTTSIGHLVVVTWCTIKNHKIENITYYDSETWKKYTLNRIQFLAIFNYRGICIQPKKILTTR